MKTRDIVIGVAVILILGIGIYFLLQNNQEEEIVIEPTPTPVAVEDIEDQFNVDIPDNAERAELRGEGALALATREVVGGLVRLSILADLPELNLDQRYQAWVVKDDPESEEDTTVPLGTLTVAKGGFTIEFSSSDDLTGYDKIIVTKELNLDSTPEEIVLEGSF